MTNKGETEINVPKLYEEFKDEFTGYFKRIGIEQEKAIPYIMSRILYTMLPKLMSTVGAYKKLSGSDKKTLVQDTVIHAIDELFTELNISTSLSQETWDEHLRDVLLMTVPMAIDTLINVEKGQLAFNPKKGFFSCFGK